MDVNIGLFWLLLAIGACKDALTWSHGRNVSSETWSSAPPDWRAWLNTRIAGDGSGDGDGDGDGYGSGSGSGYGSEDIRELMLPDGAVLAGDVPDQALQLLCEVSSRLGVDLTA